MMLLPLLMMGLWQEPEPAPPETVPPPRPEVGVPEAGTPEGQDAGTRIVTPEEVEAKLAQVTASFADADRILNRSVDDPDVPLGDAVDISARLVAEMEELLELLPAPPP
jgi:hypothetical protein